MQKILSSYKSVKGFVARQTCANDSYQILGPLKRESFDKEDSDDIASLFLRTEFPDCSVKCLRLHQKLKALTDSGRVLGSITSRRIESSNVFVQCEGSLRACQIQSFCEVQLSVANQTDESQLFSRLVAVVRWYQRHPEQTWFSPPGLVFCNFIEPWHSFILLKDIQCVAATCVKSVKFTYGEETVLCAVPLEHHAI